MHKRGPVRRYGKRQLWRKRRRHMEEDIVVDMAGDGLLEGGTSNGGGMALRNGVPWKTHTEARTLQRDCGPQTTHAGAGKR